MDKPLTIHTIEEALRKITKEQGAVLGPPELVEIGAVFTTGEPLYKANLGTKEHPFWIFGSKESVQKEVEWFQRRLLTEIKRIKYEQNITCSKEV